MDHKLLSVYRLNFISRSGNLLDKLIVFLIPCFLCKYSFRSLFVLSLKVYSTKQKRSLKKLFTILAQHQRFCLKIQQAAVDSSSISLKNFFDKKLCQAFGKTIRDTVRILVTSGAKAFIIPIFFVIFLLYIFLSSLLFEVLTVRMCGSF